MIKQFRSHHGARTTGAKIMPVVVGFMCFSVAMMAQTTQSSLKSRFVELAKKSTSSLKANFSYGPRYPTESQAVEFVDGSKGNPTSWLWNFGDGSNSTQQNPSHVYATPGFKKVTLRISKGTESRMLTRSLVIMPSTEAASFVYSPETPGPGQTVQFADTTSATITSWHWDFGDGTTSTQKNPRHVYSKEGSYNVTLIAEDDNVSRQGSKTLTVASISVITSSFSYSPALPQIGQAVQFTDSSMGSPTAWQWNFGDGAVSLQRNPVHVYTTSGSKTATLAVSNGSVSNTSSQTLRISGTSLPDASFNFSPTEPVAGQSVLFTDSSSGIPSAWLWNFGDGSTSTNQNPSHTFATLGFFNVTLTVTNSAGSGSVNRVIEVTEAGIITAASPSYADVSAALSIAKPGDTIKVPAGTATWNAQLFITKGVSIIGAGIGQTRITSTYTPPDDDLRSATKNSFLVLYTPSDQHANMPFRFSGFEVAFNVRINGVNLHLPTGVAQKNIRIDNNKFTNCDRFVQINGDFWGVVDSNYATCLIPLLTSGSDYVGWRTHTYELGTGDNLFFEDNIMIATEVFAQSGDGGRYSIRYNDFTWPRTDRHMSPCFDWHGNTAASGSSQMGVEVYENTLNLGVKTAGKMFDGRGGKAVVFNNKLLTTYTGRPGQYFREEELDNTGPNQPCNTISGQPMHVSDSYAWENRWGNGVATTLIDTGVSATLTYPTSDPLGTLRQQDLGRTIPQEDYDFFVQKPAFDGSSGVGVGLLSARPQSCSKSGVGYWATDTRTLYRWSATKGWEEFYMPYAYPHPLRNIQ